MTCRPRRCSSPWHACGTKTVADTLLAFGLLLAACCTATASQPNLVDVLVDPVNVRLSGPEAVFSLLVTGVREDGRQVDLTHSAIYRSLQPQVAQILPSGLVRGLADGTATIDVEVAGQHRQVEVTVRDAATARPFNFENDVISLLSRMGCNSSGCHGKAEGQNGFKLSVFGFDPPADYRALTMEDRGRRVFPASPDRSLLLRKATGAIPHGGGVRLERDSREYQILRDWIGGGLRFGEPTDPRVVGIELSPPERVLDFQASQQLRVVATYSDGESRDVTSLARFQSNHDGLASVDEQGLVTVANVPGQVAIMASFMGAVDVFQGIVPRPGERVDGNLASDEWVEANDIDRLVNGHLRKLNIAPSAECAEEDFLRRVYLDVIGTLPTAAEARAYLSDARSDRRARLVDDLLQRPEFADYWALQWADLLRVERGALGYQGAYAFYQWIRDSLASNKPLDQFAREIIEAQGPLADVPQANFYSVTQGPGDMASTLSQVFLGVRIACAQCHHHPFDRWSQTDYYGMVDYFAPVSRKNSPRGDVLLSNGNPETRHPRTNEVVIAHPLGEPLRTTPLVGERRRELARWFVSPDNPWFARNLANRLWAHFLGRGLVEPVDDVRATNPPTNPELLTALAQHLGQGGFDLRAMIREICASRTYQRSSKPNASNERDEQNYSRALFRRLPAEVLLDAVCQVTGVEEKFRGLPSGVRAIQLWDSKSPHYFLGLFGRPVRQSACQCERNTEASVSQVLHLLNSPEINAKIQHEAGLVHQQVARLGDDAELVDELYLAFFSRFPAAQERDRAIQYLQSAATRRQGAEDLAWGLMNTLEFIFNH